MTLDMFESRRKDQLAVHAPLATRMRPRTLDDLVGHEDVVGPGTLLRKAIDADRLSSIILWGPPGSGKTTLARIVAQTTRAHFVQLSAVTSGVADLRAAIKEAAKLSDHVIALGGGAPLKEENRQIIKSAGHRVVYLRCEPDELAKQIGRAHV